MSNARKFSKIVTGTSINITSLDSDLSNKITAVKQRLDSDDSAIQSVKTLVSNLPPGGLSDSDLKVVSDLRNDLDSETLSLREMTLDYTNYVYNATAGQTYFTGNDANSVSLSYRVGEIQIFLNGIKLEAEDFTATDGTSVTLTQPAALNNQLIILVPAVKSNYNSVIPGTDWSSLSQQAKIVSSSISEEDMEGYDVRIRGDRAITGAVNEFGSTKGAAYVFHRSGSSWTQKAKITPPSSNSSDRCGEAVAIDGNYAVVGVPGDDKVEIWYYNGSSYSRQTTLSGPSGMQNFGQDVAIEGDYVFVGDNFWNSNQGRVHVYLRSGTSWNLQATLTAGSPAAGGTNDQFGFRVRANSTATTLIVGAWSYDADIGGGAPQRKGAVYVFTRSGTTWTQRAVLEASDGAANDYFSYSIAINETGDMIVVGAPNNDTGGADTGKVYVFTGSGASWTQEAIIQPSDITSGDVFGYAVGAYDDSFAASAMMGVGTGSGNSTGTVYLFSKNNLNEWTQSKKIVSSDLADGDRFGWSVDLDQSSVIVGARDHDHNGDNQTGGTYVFTK